jgi:hypothetical protein
MKKLLIGSCLFLLLVGCSPEDIPGEEEKPPENAKKWLVMVPLPNGKMLNYYPDGEIYSPTAYDRYWELTVNGKTVRVPVNIAIIEEINKEVEKPQEK